MIILIVINTNHNIYLFLLSLLDGWFGELIYNSFNNKSLLGWQPEHISFLQFELCTFFRFFWQPPPYRIFWMIAFYHEWSVFIVYLRMLLSHCLVVQSNMAFFGPPNFHFITLPQWNLIIWVIFRTYYLHLQHSILLILYIMILYCLDDFYDEFDFIW